MNPTELSQFLSMTIPERLPVLIKGAPGVGKTDIVKQAAAAAGAELIISHPVVSDPVDFKGFPYIKDGEAHFMPFGDLQKLISADLPTVFFLDDLGQAPPSVQAAAMQLILGRRINGHRVSDLVTFVAATNRKRDKAGVSGILEPVKSRFATIVELEPDLESWVHWAIRTFLPPEIIAFIRFRPELLHDFSPSASLKNSSCPRTVHNVARLMSMGVPREIEFDVYAGAAGEGFATELVAFLSIYRTLPNVELVLLDPKNCDVPTDPATLYALCGAVTRKCSRDRMENIVAYALRLPAEFSVLLVTDCVKQCPEAANTAAFIDWSAKNSSVLI